MLRQQFLCHHIIKRFVGTRRKWPHEFKKKSNVDKALDHFDDFYKSVFGRRWGGMRAALLTEHKYVALVNNFAEPEKTREILEQNGAINVRLIYNANIGDIPADEELLGNAAQIPADHKVAKFIEKQESTEIKAIFHQNAAEKYELFQIDNADETTRIIEPIDTANFEPSLEESLKDMSDIDLNRMISPEVGILGLQEFVPATKIKGMEDFVPESDHYKYYNTTVDFPLNIETELEFVFPENLDIYTYVKSDISRFIQPKRFNNMKVYSHFLMNGASILPPLLLNVQYDDVVFDACCAPGGKSLVLLQSMLPKMIVCNDIKEKRVKRIRNLFNQYLTDFESSWLDSSVKIQINDARECNHVATYDKILVDVPCTNDRVSVTEDESNIFQSSRVKERLCLPEQQADILTNCIKMLKPGGSLVYSTCSLSPIQNDGVIHMALSKAFSEFYITATIKDLTKVITPFRRIFRLENPKNLKYGQLVLPYLPSNFGPMYICKITRNKNNKKPHKV